MSDCNHTKSELTGHQICIYKSAVEVGKELEQERIVEIILSTFWTGLIPREHVETMLALIRKDSDAL